MFEYMNIIIESSMRIIFLCSVYAMKISWNSNSHAVTNRETWNSTPIFIQENDQ